MHAHVRFTRTCMHKRMQAHACACARSAANSSFATRCAHDALRGKQGKAERYPLSMSTSFMSSRLRRGAVWAPPPPSPG